MKKIVFLLFFLITTHTMAEEIISFGQPSVDGPNGTAGHSRNVDAKSDLDGVCRFIGADEYVKGSVKTRRERYLSNCGVSTFDNGLLAYINAEGKVEKVYGTKKFESINSRLGRISCLEYYSHQKIISKIKCRKL